MEKPVRNLRRPQHQDIFDLLGRRIWERDSKDQKREGKNRRAHSAHTKKKETSTQNRDHEPQGDNRKRIVFTKPGVREPKSEKSRRRNEATYRRHRCRRPRRLEKALALPPEKPGRNHRHEHHVGVEICPQSVAGQLKKRPRKYRHEDCSKND